MKKTERRHFLQKIGKILFFSFGLHIFMPFFKKNALALTPEIVIYNLRRLTPASKKDAYGKPEYFPTTNNLRRKCGSAFLGVGNYLFIEGLVTDIADVPIENVRIKIWQANFRGYYNHLLDEEDERYDQDFLGAGIASTNNEGYYCFITVMPGSYEPRCPHIHISIEHDSFEPLETEIFFPNHQLNKTDPHYRTCTHRNANLLTGITKPALENDPEVGQKMLFNIKLNGLHPYKRY